MVLLYEESNLKRIHKPRKYYKISVLVKRANDVKTIDSISKSISKSDFNNEAKGELTSLAYSIAKDKLKTNDKKGLLSNMTSCFNGQNLLMGVLPGLMSGNLLATATPTIRCLSQKLIEKLYDK